MKKDTLLKRILSGTLLGLLLILLLTLLKVTVTGYMVASVLYGLIFLAAENHNRKKWQKKRRELSEIDDFLSAVRHEFHDHGMIDEAVTEAAMLSRSKFIKNEASKILDVLEAEDITSAADIYRTSGCNKYLGVFLTLCMTVEEFGDRRDGEGSLFLNNLMNLKEELRLEKEADELLNSKMAGVCVVSAAPAFCLKLIEGWSISNLPEMQDFYGSRAGITMLACLFTLSAVVYAINYLLRNVNRCEITVDSPLEKIKISRGTGRFLYRISNMFRRYSSFQTKLLKRAGLGISVERLYFFELIPAAAVLFVSVTACIVSKVSGEESVYAGFIITLLILCFLVPDILLLLKAALNRMKREEEVMQYQTIVGMLAGIEYISVYEILEELERFSTVFRRNISDCLNDYNSGQESALEELGSTGCDGMKRLSDRLVMCDRIGVKKAMDELETDRSYYIKTRERTAGETVEKRAVLGKFLAFVPLVASVGLYLIIPFAGESIRLLTEIGSELTF